MIAGVAGRGFEMSASQQAVTIGETSLDVMDVHRHLHRQGRLTSVLREAAIERFLFNAAKRLGMSATREELQTAADDFRSRHGLHSARDTNSCLERQKLSLDDFESRLEHDLVIGKLRVHVTRDRLTQHFEDHRESFAGVSLHQILVRQEDIARELLQQIEEGAEFVELARQHSVHASRHQGGFLGWRMRRDFPAPLADVVFATVPGKTCGPLHTTQGFCLFLIDAFRAPELDAATAAIIRKEIFDEWLADQLKSVVIAMPLLDALG